MAQGGIIYLLRRAWEYALGYRKIFILYILMLCFAQVMSLAEPWVIGQLLNTVQNGGSSSSIMHTWMNWLVALISSAFGEDKQTVFHFVLAWLAVFFFAQIFFWCFHGPARIMERLLSFQIRANYKKELFTFVTQLPVKWHKDNHSGENIDRINRASGSLSEFISQSFEVIYTMLRLGGSIVILFYFMWQAAVIAIIATLVALTVIFIFDRFLFRQYKQLNLFENRVASAVHDYVTNIITVITLRLENRVVDEVSRRIYNALPLFRKNVVINESKWLIGTMMINITIVATLGWYAWTTVGSGETMLAGTFFTLFEYLRRIGGSFFDFTGKYSSIVRFSADIQNAEPIHNSYRHVRRATSQSFLPDGWKEISVANLNFSYEDDENRVRHLKNLSIELSRNSRIALVGESGSGKTTLLNVLRGLQFTKKVSVLCDGSELENKLFHLARHTTLIPQEPEIFADSVIFNITFGVKADEAEVMEAIRLARFESVLGRLPNGLETNISQKGINLSGGERQRLALARGIFAAKGSSIILLDESTSSVDVQNENLIYQGLLRHFSDHCIVSSIHKLHLLTNFDTIYVLNQGEIIETGSLDELLARKGALARMWHNYMATTGSTVKQTSAPVDSSKQPVVQ